MTLLIIALLFNLYVILSLHDSNFNGLLLDTDDQSVEPVPDILELLVGNGLKKVYPSILSPEVITLIDLDLNDASATTYPKDLSETAQAIDDASKAIYILSELQSKAESYTFDVYDDLVTIYTDVNTMLLNVNGLISNTYDTILNNFKSIYNYNDASNESLAAQYGYYYAESSSLSYTMFHYLYVLGELKRAVLLKLAEYYTSYPGDTAGSFTAINNINNIKPFLLNTSFFDASVPIFLDEISDPATQVQNSLDDFVASFPPNVIDNLELIY